MIKTKNIKIKEKSEPYDIKNYSFLKSQELLKKMNSSLSKEVLKERRSSK